MSVQAGIWNFDGRRVETELIEEFSRSLKQNGPDGEFLHLDGSLALVYRPFHTTAESRRETQPYVSRRGFVLTWDGRLDNRNKLIFDLHCDVESEATDVAIIAAAFDRWETGCFQRFVGDWAMSVWQPQYREVLFAVDYMAIRHIFYYVQQDRILWSTDLAALVLLTGDKFHIDDDYIAGYLAQAPDAHLTPYREIREAPPGHFVQVRNGSVSSRRYWRFSPRSRIRYKTDQEYEEHFRIVFAQSVRRRLRSDSPILAELSGGLDSSSIVCVADELLKNETGLTPRLGTISFFDKTEPNGDDCVYFPRIEEKRGQVGAHIDASALGSSQTLLESSEFCALPGSLAIGQQLKAVRAEIVRRDGFRVVLSGIGGDEFMGGIPDPSAHLADLLIQFRFIKLAKQLTAWSLVKRRPWCHLLGRAFLSLLPTILGQYCDKRAKDEAWIEKDFARRIRIGLRLLTVEEHFGLWLPTRRHYASGVMLMANELAKWTTSALTPEEGRFPYLDQDLLEFVLSIPATQLLRPGERRSLMRRALRGIVPQEVLFRQTKQLGARTPIVAMGEIVEELQMVFDSALSWRLGYVNGAKFMEAIRAARIGKEAPIVPMLKTISLEFWLRDLASRNLFDRTTISRRPTSSDRLMTTVDTPQKSFHHSR